MSSIEARSERERVKGQFLRGDPITGDRYHSREFAQKEWERVFARTWQIGGMTYQLAKTGDLITHNVGTESILMVRDEDGTLRAFYNACPHRGNRLVMDEARCGPRRMVCAYHSWAFSLDGVVRHVRDAEDYPQGSPVGKLGLKQIRCETLGGLVWFNMDPDAPSLRDYLGVVAEQLEAYHTDDWVRVQWLTGEVPCNWKIIHDNFNESYHVLSLHRELGTFIDDAYQNTDFDLYQSGHNRMRMKGCLPSSSSRVGEVQAPLDAMMRQWDLDPAAFTGRVREVRAAMQQQKRTLGPARGYHHYAHLPDDQLTDYHHFTLFPNISLTMSADGYQVLRPQPHPSDPEKCHFDHWFMVPRVDGVDEVATPVGMRKVEPSAHETFMHGEASLGFVADQDLSVAAAQQLGLHSRGYQDAYLSGQEARVRRLHELINDYIEGRR